MKFSQKCREQDSNLHTFRYQNLNLARLPIPPSRLAGETLPGLAHWASPQCEAMGITCRNLVVALIPREFEGVEAAAEMGGVGEGLELAEGRGRCLAF